MKIRIVEIRPSDLFIIDETSAPVAVGRVSTMFGALQKIVELTGSEVNLEEYPGDYLYGLLLDQEDRALGVKNASLQEDTGRLISESDFLYNVLHFLCRPNQQPDAARILVQNRIHSLNNQEKKETN